MRQSKNLLVERDLIGIVEHIVKVMQGDFDATVRWLDEINDLIRDIAANATSGMLPSTTRDRTSIRPSSRSLIMTHPMCILQRAETATQGG